MQNQVDDHDRQGGNQRAGGKDTPVLGVLPGGEDLQTNHDGLHFALSQEGPGDNEFTIGTDETQNRDDDQNRAQQRQDQLREDLPVGGAVHMSRFIDIARDGIHITLHQPDVHAHGTAGIDQNQAGVGVQAQPGDDIPDLLGNGEQGDDGEQVREALDE